MKSSRKIWRSRLQTNGLTQEQIDYIAKQEDYLKNMISSIYEVPLRGDSNLRDIAENIRILKEDIKVGKEDDLPALYFQLNLQYNLATKFSRPQELPDTDSPYFGHMKLKEGNKIRDLFLGHTSFASKDRAHRIIDWKQSPLSRVYYQYDEGDDFELDLPEKTLEGDILEKSVLTIEQKKLVRIDRNGTSYIKLEDGWSTYDQVSVKLSGGEGSAVRSLGTGRTNFNSPDVISLLDKNQFDLMNRSPREPLLIIGGAGSGKTTVALYRIARLCAKKNFYPQQCLVVVPNKGLVRLSKGLLDKIGMSKAHIRIGPVWIEDQVRKLINDIPKRVCYETPLSSSMIKRHASFITLLEEHVQRRSQKIADKLDEICEDSTLKETYLKRRHLSPYERLNEVLLKHQNMTTLQKLFIQDEKKSLMNVRADLEAILYNKNNLLQLKQLSEGVVTERMINDSYEHTMRQLQYIEDNSSSDQLGLDGKSLNDGTPFSIHGTIDEEDFPLMLKLLQLNIGNATTNKGRIKKYKHIVLDEAQELSPVELMCFSMAIHDSGTFTVAGDAAQQIDKSVSFTSWDNILDHLGVESVKAQELSVSYRSPESIISFAHHVLGDLAPHRAPEAKRSGGPVIKSLVQHRAHASTILYDELAELTRREPKASIAIICNEMATAREFYKELHELGNVRMIEDSEFEFKPGVDITNVDQIRGLEFDYVILPDLDLLTYPVNPRSRKRLHLAATRAIHQLWVMHTKTPSLLIPEGI